MGIEFINRVSSVWVTTFAPGPNNISSAPMGFKKGFFLQAVNPKVAVYGLTRYSTFLSSAAGNFLLLTVLALLFALTAFCAAAILTTLLVYCAIDLSGFSHY